VTLLQQQIIFLHHFGPTCLHSYLHSYLTFYIN